MVGAVTRPEGLCHVINGGADRSFSQGRERLCREAGFLHGLCKGGDEECAEPWFVEMFEEGVEKGVEGGNEETGARRFSRWGLLNPLPVKDGGCLQRQRS